MLAAVIATLAGAILLIVGWVHMSGTGFVSEQLPYLASEGLGGVFLLGSGRACCGCRRICAISGVNCGPFAAGSTWRVTTGAEPAPGE